MRITNSMLVSNYLSDLNTNLNRLSKLQTQMDTGKKFTHLSDDPISLIYSEQARYKLNRLSHYQSNVATAQEWLTASETSVMELNKILKSAYEATVDASTNVKTADDLKNMAEYLGQLRDQVVNTLNTAFGDKYIFGGYNTTGHTSGGQNVPPFTVETVTETYDYLDADGNQVFHLDSLGNPTGSALTYTVERQKLCYNGVDVSDPANAGILDQLRKDVLTFDVGVGVDIGAALNGLDVIFYQTDGSTDKNIFQLLDDLYVSTKHSAEFSTGWSTALSEAGTSELIAPTAVDIPNINRYISELQSGQSHQLAKAADIGGRTNRLAIISARYEQDEINYTQMKSDAEDVDEAEAIMNYQMALTAYKAALSSGSYVIQPTLMDFLK